MVKDFSIRIVALHQGIELESNESNQLLVLAVYMSNVYAVSMNAWMHQC